VSSTACLSHYGNKQKLPNADDERTDRFIHIQNLEPATSFPLVEQIDRPGWCHTIPILICFNTVVDIKLLCWVAANAKQYSVQNKITLQLSKDEQINKTRLVYIRLLLQH
jgi:hypothetical protein